MVKVADFQRSRKEEEDDDDDDDDRDDPRVSYLYTWCVGRHMQACMHAYRSTHEIIILSSFWIAWN